MSASEEIKLLKMVIETQASRITEQEATIKELREVIDELRSIKANLDNEAKIIEDYSSMSASYVNIGGLASTSVSATLNAITQMMP